MIDTERAGCKTNDSDRKVRNSGPDWRRYADIIDEPHHVSKKHKRMSMEERAAQFSPFAALTGYEAAVKETARLTDEQEELDEDEKALINESLQQLYLHIAKQPEVIVTYFEPDERKSGGSRKSITGRLRKIDRDRQILVLDRTYEIQISSILKIQPVKNTIKMD